jgi:DNA-binding SARP family transcriptional activator
MREIVSDRLTPEGARALDCKIGKTAKRLTAPRRLARQGSPGERTHGPVRSETARRLRGPARQRPEDPLAQGKPRTRDQLAGLLWSDRGDAQAKGSLRQALTALRHGLPENGAPAIEADGEAVALEASAVAVDVLAFERLATNGSNGNLAEAGALYHGPLLEGFTARDPAFDEWLAQERARLHALAVGAAERLLAGLLADGDTATAITAAQRLLALEPERESATRTLMRLYAEQGQRGLAARQYETCREVLSSTLGVEPAPATRRLYEEIVGATEPEPAAEPRRHAPLPLPSIPSVAVLPFANLSGEATASPKT